MSIIKWREAFSTGIDSFDEDHKKIVNLIADLFEGLRDKKNKVDLDRIVKECMVYVDSHLAAEEKAMQEHGYDQLDEHKVEHDGFRKHIEELQGRLSGDSEGLAQELYNYLREWFSKHIMDIDMKYGPFFKEKGL